MEALLDDLTQQNWLSDSRVAEHIVNHRRAKFGIQRIAHELRQKGLDEALIANALPQLKESESETARSLWQKKFGKPPQDDKEKAKQIRFLQSRGFSLDVILRVIRSSEYEQ